MQNRTGQVPHPKVATPRSQLKRKHGEIIEPVSDDDEHVKPTDVRSQKGSTKQVVSRPQPPPTQQDGPAQNQPSNGQHGQEQSPHRKLEDEEDEDPDTESIFEDILDNIELDPYRPDAGDDQVYSPEQCKQLQQALRKHSPNNFMNQYLRIHKVEPRKLGSAFGIDPDTDLPDELYLDLLRAALYRFYRKRQKLTQYNTIDDAAKLLRAKCNIMVITGAGISTSLGIPDFRSKGTGFYDKVRALGYNEGEEVFQIERFDQDPSVFYSLAGDILPDLKRFSPTHAFIRLLQDQKKLQTNYTQNIDNLEELAGIERSRLIQCHGSFATASCRKCKFQVPGRVIFDDIRQKRVAKCRRCVQRLKDGPPVKPPLKKRKSKPSLLRKNDWEDSSDEDESAYDIPQPGVMKPDITFFGEQLSDKFFDRFTEQDSKTVDLVVVIGTSLKVAPVSEMPNYLPKDVPHIYISREPIEHVNFDIQLLGQCDHVVYELCRRAGWLLQHEMVPKGFEAQIAPVEGYGYRWQIIPKVKQQEKKPLQNERPVPLGSKPLVLQQQQK